MEKPEREAKLQQLVAKLCETLFRELKEFEKAGDSGAQILATAMTGATIFSAHCMAAYASLAPDKSHEAQCAHIDKSTETLARIAAEYAKKMCAIDDDEKMSPLASMLKH